MKTTSYYKDMARYLTKLSKDICQNNECTNDQHNCESYAYFTACKDGDYILETVCLSDYCQRRYDIALPLPFEGGSQELLSALEYELLSN